MDHKRCRSKAFGKLLDFFSSLLWRVPSDRIILPLIREFRGVKVCDVGCGSGVYSRIFMENGNDVSGVDLNPQLCRLKMDVLQKDAVDFADAFSLSPCDVVFSGWMSEYLDTERLSLFFRQAFLALRQGGTFITTLIPLGFWGRIYIFLAKSISGVEKHTCEVSSALDMLEKTGFKDVRVVKLDSWGSLPWAFLCVCRK